MMSIRKSYKIPNQLSKTSNTHMIANKHSMPSMIVITSNIKTPIDSRMPRHPRQGISMTSMTTRQHNMPTHTTILPIDMPSLTANMTTKLPRSVRSRGVMR